MEIKENQVLKIIFVSVSEEKSKIYTETCGKCCLNDDGAHCLFALCPMFAADSEYVGPLYCTAQAREDHKNGYYIASLQDDI